MASAGRVLIIPRGDWDSETQYEKLDLVNHEGYAWLAKRTVVGIEPSNEHKEYWHNLLDINKLVADVLAEDVGDILEQRFRDMFSEATYVGNLKADFAEPMFAKWDAKTTNTPYASGVTECADGFALVYGDYAENHTIVAWTKDGECYTHSVSGGVVKDWDKSITSSGGTMTGPLGLGGGSGSVFADEEGASLQASKDEDNYRSLLIANPSNEDIPLEESAKVVESVGGAKNEYNLFGEHNTDLLSATGFCRIETGSYVGNGKSGYDEATETQYVNTLTFGFKPKIVFISIAEDYVGTYYNHPIVNPFISGSPVVLGACKDKSDAYFGPYQPFTLHLTWEGNSVSWYSATSYDSSTASSDYHHDPKECASVSQMNVGGIAFNYVAIG